MTSSLASKYNLSNSIISMPYLRKILLLTLMLINRKQRNSVRL